MFDPPRRLNSSLPHPKLDASSAADAEAAAAIAAASDVAGESGAMLDDAADAPTVGLWEAAEREEDADADTAADRAADVQDQAETDAQPDIELQPDMDAQLAADSPPELPAGDLELDLGRAALDAGDPDEAAVRLGIALRVAPALAPAVLDVVAGRTERNLVLVRGDAYRLVGREIEAQRAYAEAARGAASPPSTAPSDDTELPHSTDHSTDDPSEGDPA
jgi:hypothetical protein